MATSEGTTELPHSTITIATPSDLTVEVTEYVVTRRFEGDADTLEGRIVTSSTATETASLLVNRAKVIESGEYFRAMLGGRRSWTEGGSNTITLREDTIKSMEVWFRVFHSCLSAQSVPYDSVSIAEIWHIIVAGDKYGFDRKRLKEWFGHWYSAEIKAAEVRDGEIDHHLIRQLLLPCFKFDHAKGFQALTKRLAYECSRHITEDNPTALHNMHLPQRVIQQLNAAKGRLRTILLRELFTTTRSIVASARCNCKEQTVFRYLRELGRIRVSPMDDTLSKTSIQEILDRLQRFNESNMRPRSASTVPGAASTTGTNSARTPGRCEFCSRSWKVVVEAARETTASYFDGLCLDCMNRKRNIRPGGDEDDDYWNHQSQRRNYDGNCRITHGEPTWYFSFMGRREEKRLD